MSNNPAPPDQIQRQQALQPEQSILVQAPAGSGKTDLLTRRFLRLLSQVEEPGQVVAITFTNAAAAEMRHRILAELEKAAQSDTPAATDEFSMDALARRALDRSRLGGWKLLDLPAQLRISTIDSFCRDLAVQQPLLSGLGGGLDIAEQPAELYHRAARSTLRKIDTTGSDLSQAIESLLLWRDNGWQEMEDLLVKMLGERDRWMHEFVLGREQDPDALRERLERPFANAVQAGLVRLDQLFFHAPGAQEELLKLARYACEQSGGALHRDLAELAEFPSSASPDDALEAYLGAAALLLTGDGAFRKAVDKRHGFPADRKREKARLLELIASLAQVPGLESALAAVRSLPPAHYPENDWQIVRACFTLLRHAAGELQVVFAEAGAVDFVEVAQIAQRVLRGPDGLPTDAALAVSDGIRHLLVDEFQDTSRRQHQLLASLVAAWPERTGRTCFAVGDPMQSIYFFRDADAELFPRVKTLGLEIPNDEPLLFDFVPLQANFRTAPSLVQRLNTVFGKVFAADDGSGVSFAAAQPMREETSAPEGAFALHLDFVLQAARGQADDKEVTRAAQTDEIVALIRSHLDRMEAARLARANGEDARYRVAVLGRARSALAPIAQALRDAEIPFRALDLEKLQARPEVLDALALARALLNPQDRVAWLGVLRAPWCGLALSDLHLLTSADNPALRDRPVPDLLAERLPLLSELGTRAAARVLDALVSVPGLRASQPTASLGTWLQQVWLRLGGAACVDATARANLDLLWGCLDHLPAGEQDLLGPGLTAALDKLTAQPDPAASAECGVQLMTIHKSKGLEFEVVIVPELQARGGNGGRKMLSWLERGVAHPDESGEITEFLIAPLPTKGADRGKAKEWVDGIYRQRESQEDRRILYVAATRAREELHFFARPACKEDSSSELVLAEPAGSLLATAWPALEEEVRARFEQWKAGHTAAQDSEENVVDSIAAVGQSNLLVMPAPEKPTILRRLPQDYQPSASGLTFETREDALGALEVASGTREGSLYTRHQGGLLSRALGTAVHALLEELARLRTTLDWDATRAALQPFEPRIAAQIRAAGVEPVQAADLAAKAMSQALSASRDPNGQWILSPHPQAQSEARWAGVVAGGLRTVQVDRVFRAGLDPLSEGEQAWWIVDYKTAHADNIDPAVALPEFRKIFAPQLMAYAQVLRNLHGQDSVIRAGLYYPRMAQFDTWEL
jgi:ATP-dependent exoDNAse (exonuclease V) beta subunit